MSRPRTAYIYIYNFNIKVDPNSNRFHLYIYRFIQFVKRKRNAKLFSSTMCREEDHCFLCATAVPFNKHGILKEDIQMTRVPGDQMPSQ